MTLGDLWTAARRWWWMLLVPALLAFGGSTLIWWTAAPRWAVETRVMIGPLAGAGERASDGWDVTDRIIDDLPVVVNSTAFAGAVAQRAGLNLSAAELSGAFSVTALHRSLTLRVELADAAQATAAAQSATALLRESGLQYWGGSGGLPLVMLDSGTAISQRSLRTLLVDGGLRGLLGLTAGWGGAIWLESRRRTAVNGR